MQGQGKGWPPHSSCYFGLFFSWQGVHLFSRRMSLRSHQTGDVSDMRRAFPLYFGARGETNKRGNGPVFLTRALARTNAPARTEAFNISYQSAK